MYLTFCTLLGPGHDMTAQWENECISHSVEYINGCFLADHTKLIYSEPVWQKMVQSSLNGTTQLWTSGGPMKINRREKNG